MTERPAWYTDDRFRVTLGTLWQVARGQGLLLGPQVFLIFLFQKVVGWRSRAVYGIARPSRLAVAPEADVPQEVLDHLALYRQASAEAGLRLRFLTNPRSIGHRTAYSAVFLSEDGRVGAVASRVRWGVGRFIAEHTTFACQSRTADGTALTTQVAGPRVVQPDEVMPGVELEQVAPDATPAEIIAAHLRRIEGRSDLVMFNDRGLADDVLAEGQRFFDWRVERGYLVPLTTREVRRLGG